MMISTLELATKADWFTTQTWSGGCTRALAAVDISSDSRKMMEVNFFISGSSGF
jgi:hypothetical protein